MKIFDRYNRKIEIGDHIVYSSPLGEKNLKQGLVKEIKDEQVSASMITILTVEPLLENKLEEIYFNNTNVIVI